MDGDESQSNNEDHHPPPHEHLSQQPQENQPPLPDAPPARRYGMRMTRARQAALHPPSDVEDDEPTPIPQRRNPHTKLRPSEIQKGPWSAQEDDLLRRIVEQHGAQHWSNVATYIPGRAGKQCRERWVNFLDPSLSKGPWTEEEDILLGGLIRKYENKWALMSKIMQENGFHRTDNSIKNRWNSSQRRQQELMGDDQPIELKYKIPSSAKKQARGNSGSSVTHTTTNTNATFTTFSNQNRVVGNDISQHATNDGDAVQGTDPLQFDEGDDYNDDDSQVNQHVSFGQNSQHPHPTLLPLPEGAGTKQLTTSMQYDKHGNLVVTTVTTYLKPSQEATNYSNNIYGTPKKSTPRKPAGKGGKVMVRHISTPGSTPRPLKPHPNPQPILDDPSASTTTTTSTRRSRRFADTEELVELIDPVVLNTKARRDRAQAAQRGTPTQVSVLHTQTTHGQTDLVQEEISPNNASSSTLFGSNLTPNNPLQLGLMGALNSSKPFTPNVNTLLGHSKVPLLNSTSSTTRQLQIPNNKYTGTNSSSLLKSFTSTPNKTAPSKSFVSTPNKNAPSSYFPLNTNLQDPNAQHSGATSLQSPLLTNYSTQHKLLHTPRGGAHGDNTNSEDNEDNNGLTLHSLFNPMQRTPFTSLSKQPTTPFINNIFSSTTNASLTSQVDRLTTTSSTHSNTNNSTHNNNHNHNNNNNNNNNSSTTREIPLTTPLKSKKQQNGSNQGNNNFLSTSTSLSGFQSATTPLQPLPGDFLKSMVSPLQPLTTTSNTTSNATSSNQNGNNTTTSAQSTTSKAMLNLQSPQINTLTSHQFNSKSPLPAMTVFSPMALQPPSQHHQQLPQNDTTSIAPFFNSNQHSSITSGPPLPLPAPPQFNVKRPNPSFTNPSLSTNNTSTASANSIPTTNSASLTPSSTSSTLPALSTTPSATSVTPPLHGETSSQQQQQQQQQQRSTLIKPQLSLLLNNPLTPNTTSMQLPTTSISTSLGTPKSSSTSLAAPLNLSTPFLPIPVPQQLADDTIYDNSRKLMKSESDNSHDGQSLVQLPLSPFTTGLPEANASNLQSTSYPPSTTSASYLTTPLQPDFKSATSTTATASALTTQNDQTDQNSDYYPNSPS